MTNTTFPGALAGGLILIISLLPKDGMTIDLNNKIYVPGDGGSSSLLDTPNLSWEKIAEHYTPAKGIDDWQKLVKKRHWKKGFSAYETAFSWHNANPDLPPEIQALFGDSAELLIATPEHVTPLQGIGTGSHSDVLAFVHANGKTCAVTVEGKVGESFGDTVGAWLKKASSENSLANRKKRLKGIYAELDFAQPPSDDIRYQLLHRTAAAILEAKRFKTSCAAMVVQSFSPEQKSFEDFAAFLELFDIDSVEPGRLYATKIHDTHLHFGWVTSPKQSVATADATALAKTTAPPKPATSVGKSSINTTLIVALIGGLVIVVCLGFYLKKLKRRVLEYLVEFKGILELIGAPQIKGRNFEKYIKSRFKNPNFKVVDNSKTSYPDLKVSFTVAGQEELLAIECKYRGTVENAVTYGIASEKQLRNYQNYERRKGEKFFIVLGMEGTADTPKHICIIPVGGLTKSKLTKDQLRSFYQKGNSSFSYDCRTKELKLE